MVTYTKEEGICGYSEGGSLLIQIFKKDGTWKVVHATNVLTRKPSGDIFFGRQVAKIQYEAFQMLEKVIAGEIQPQ